LDESRDGQRSSVQLRLLNAARVVLLAGPTALAFFTGGYFDRPRLWAGLIAWVLVVTAVLARESPFARSGPSLLALLGLASFAAWSLFSITWAPVAGNAYDVGQRLVLYVGTLFAATALLRTRSAQRAVEPALAAGTLLVIAYGLSERLLPGLLHFQRSVSAQGRLEQPLTYWNAIGALAALGIVLAVRVAGDTERTAPLRAAAAAATAPLGMGLYLAFSRGALFACAAGLLALIVAAPTQAQFRALLLSISAGVAAALSAAPFAGVTSLTGAQATRELQGAITLALLAAIVVGAGAVQWRLTRGEHGGRLRLPRRAPLIALGVVCAGFALAVAAGSKESSTQPLGAGATRLATFQSDRYDYWRVAFRVFAHQPLRGVGAGGWSVYWLRWRPLHIGAQDAHSLPLQTLAELGLVGLALVAAFLGGVGAAARRAHRMAPVLAAGPLAGFVAYVAHAPLDWDWEMPAVTLVALVLAGSLLALADGVDPAADNFGAGAQRTSERLANLMAANGRKGNLVAARRMPAIAGRLVALVVALIVCAWFALGIRQAQDLARVNALLASHSKITATQARGANASLDDAQFLNPDQSVAAVRAIVESRAGDRERAVAIAESVTRREPQSVDGWLLLSELAVRSDPTIFHLAQARISALAPPVPTR
jgi:hypothetical protein